MTVPPGIRVAWRAVRSPADRRSVSRGLLAEELPGASLTSRCPACGGDHGRIRVEGVDAAVSVSYVPGWAVVAVSHDHARIGIDAVPADAGGLERVLPDATDALAWARAEAVLKADGRGLRVDPSRVTVRAITEGWLAWIAERAVDDERRPSRAPGGEHSTRAWRGWDLDAPSGVVAALVVG